MDDQLPLIVQIIASVIAGHAAPEMFRQTAFGPMGRVLLGVIGGVFGSAVLKFCVDDKIAQSLSTLAGSAISGAALGATFTLLVSAACLHMKSNKPDRTDP